MLAGGACGLVVQVMVMLMVFRLILWHFLLRPPSQSKVDYLCHHLIVLFRVLVSSLTRYAPLQNYTIDDTIGAHWLTRTRGFNSFSSANDLLL